MYSPTSETKMAGVVARCAKGRLGIILFQYEQKDGTRVYRGVTLDAGTKWQSKNPVIVAESLVDYYDTL